MDLHRHSDWSITCHMDLHRHSDWSIACHMDMPGHSDWSRACHPETILGTIIGQLAFACDTKIVNLSSVAIRHQSPFLKINYRDGSSALSLLTNVVTTRITAMSCVPQEISNKAKLYETFCFCDSAASTILQNLESGLAEMWGVHSATL